MLSTDDDIDDFQPCGKSNSLKRSLEASNSPNVSNSILDRYSNNEEVTSELICNNKSIKVQTYYAQFHKVEFIIK